MSDAWTPLDDLGRCEAGFVHQMRRFGEAHRRLEESRVRALASFDRCLKALAGGNIDWSEATDEEAEEMAAALDTIYAVRDAVAGVAR